MDEDQILYGKRQSPQVMRDLDKIALEVNSKIRMRGISKGLICTQETFNNDILSMERFIYWASIENDPNKRRQYIESSIICLRNISVVLRYMLKNKVLTIGEIGVIAKYKNAINDQLYRWLNSIASG